MKAAILALLIGLTITAPAQERYVTLTFTPDYANPDGYVRTNALDIAVGESLQLVDVVSAYPFAGRNEGRGTMDIFIQKDGPPYLLHDILLNPFGVTSLMRPIIAGPARLMVVSTYGMLTVKIIPTAVNPNQTLIVPPGPGGNVVMECSSNLVNWVTATNGVYADPTTAKFFRIRLESLPIAPAAPK